MEPTTQAPAGFFQLSQEIRDMIYGHAYGPRAPVSRIIHVIEWQKREIEKRDDQIWNLEFNQRWGQPGPINADDLDEIRPFPDNPFHAMLVSKRFFNEAVNDWFHRATLRFPSVDDLDKFIQALNVTPISGITAIQVDWDGGRYSEGRFTPNVRWCTGLTKLQVTLTDGLQFFGEKSHKLDFLDKLDAKDFKALQIVRDISTMPSLMEFEILPGENKRAKTTREAERYHGNVRSLQTYIQACINSSVTCNKFSARAMERAKLMIDYHPNLEAKEFNPIHVAKEFAFLRALSDPEEAAAMVHYAMVQFGASQSEPQAINDVEKNTAEQDGSTIRTDNVPLSEETCPIKQNFPQKTHAKALNSERKNSRISKPPQRQRSRSRLTTRDVVFGGVLFANMVCSMLALYLATQR